jgi:hypothetical protein
MDEMIDSWDEEEGGRIEILVALLMRAFSYKVDS